MIQEEQNDSTSLTCTTRLSNNMSTMSSYGTNSSYDDDSMTDSVFKCKNYENNKKIMVDGASDTRHPIHMVTGFDENSYTAMFKHKFNMYYENVLKTPTTTTP